MRIVLLGPPGSGKGTYASRLSPILNIPHIATGAMVRKEISEQTKLGEAIKEHSNKGGLVPDQIIIQLLKKRIGQSDCENGFILDGFPRTKKQAEALEEIAVIDMVINLNVPDEIIIQRLSNRLTCRDCGTIYNRITLKPRLNGVCDKCEGELIQRKDDEPEVVQERLNLYRQKTQPLIDYYRKKSLLKDVFCEDLETPPKIMIEKIMLLLDQFTRK
ncbi:MAG: adenylate kinase [Candidatus Bathyarchaeota archaeon]